MPMRRILKKPPHSDLTERTPRKGYHSQYVWDSRMGLRRCSKGLRACQRLQNSKLNNKLSAPTVSGTSARATRIDLDHGYRLSGRTVSAVCEPMWRRAHVRERTWQRSILAISVAVVSVAS